MRITLAEWIMPTRTRLNENEAADTIVIVFLGVWAMEDLGLGS